MSTNYHRQKTFAVHPNRFPFRKVEKMPSIIETTDVGEDGEITEIPIVFVKSKNADKE